MSPYIHARSSRIYCWPTGRDKNSTNRCGGRSPFPVSDTGFSRLSPSGYSMPVLIPPCIPPCPITFLSTRYVRADGKSWCVESLTLNILEDRGGDRQNIRWMEVDLCAIARPSVCSRSVGKLQGPMQAGSARRAYSCVFARQMHWMLGYINSSRTKTAPIFGDIEKWFRGERQEREGRKSRGAGNPNAPALDEGFYQEITCSKKNLKFPTSSDHISPSSHWFFFIFYHGTIWMKLSAERQSLIGLYGLERERI